MIDRDAYRVNSSGGKGLFSKSFNFKIVNIDSCIFLEHSCHILKIRIFFSSVSQAIL